MMIKSMTGYGKGTASLSTGKLTIEFRTLNSKSCDINIKTSLIPKEKELGVRKLIADSLERGTIDMVATFEPKASQTGRSVNSDLVKNYFKQVSAIASECGVKNCQDTVLATVLRFPDIFDTERKDIIPEEEWPKVQAAIVKALEQTDAYRCKEGKALYKDVTSRVEKIQKLEDKVESHEKERTEKVAAKILKNAADLGISLDKERFEQEMIFYLEKMDINEEKVRLRQHCKYFMDTIDKEAAPGKKLGFIIQEMGREINTTGSKANHAAIQKLVVQMKDELEKIREQSMNIL